MAIQARCPSCASVIRAGDKYAGQRVKCPKCGGTISVPAPSAAPAEPTAAAPQAPPPAAPSPAPAESAAVAPPPDNVPAVAAAATPSDHEAAGRPVTGPVEAVGEPQPFVAIADEGAQQWKRVVSRTGRSRRRTPGWLWPVAGGLLCAVAVGFIVLVFTRSDDDPADSASQADAPQQQRAANNGSSELESDALAADSGGEPGADEREGAAPNGADEQQTGAAAESLARREGSDDFPQPSLASPAADIPGEPLVRGRVDAEDAAGAKPLPDTEPEAAPDPVASTGEPQTESPAEPEMPDVPLTPEGVLEKHELRIFGDRAVHTGEQQVNAALDAAEKFRKDLRKANGEWMLRQRQLAALTREMTLLRQQYGVVNANLARVNATRPLDATTNNVLVGQAEAISTRIELLEQQHKQLTEASDAMRKRVAELREGFVQNVLDARKLVDTIQQVYDQSGDEVRTALEKLAEAAGEEAYVLEPSRTFTRNVRELTSLEEQILSDTIEVRDQGGNLYVNVVINGKHTQEMVVDSGATIVLLPWTMAEEVGLKPDAAAPELLLELADGRTITGRAITIPSLRVGRFTVENVEAAVLGPEAISATPLLGMSFLGQYRFEIDNARGLLKLVEVDKAESPRSR